GVWRPLPGVARTPGGCPVFFRPRPWGRLLRGAPVGGSERGLLSFASRLGYKFFFPGGPKAPPPPLPRPLLAPLLLIAAGIVMHPMTPRRALVALLAVVALPALLALTSWLLPTRRVLENESADAFVWQWDADRDGAISRDELKQ